MNASNLPALKVVLHFTNKKVLKGFLLNGNSEIAEGVIIGPPKATNLPEILNIRSTNGQSLTAKVSDCKAVFFVKDFDGRDKTDLRFFRDTDTSPGIWVRLRFQDGEVSEGLVPNSLAFVVEPAFYLKPADLQSNNMMVYVLKKSLQSLEVLGVK